MSWELVNDRPIWVQLIEQLTRRIVSGEYPPGARVPSVRDLAAEAGVNPNTMQRALSGLEERGLLVAQRSIGAFIVFDMSMNQFLLFAVLLGAAIWAVWLALTRVLLNRHLNLE